MRKADGQHCTDCDYPLLRHENVFGDFEVVFRSQFR